MLFRRLMGGARMRRILVSCGEQAAEASLTKILSGEYEVIMTRGTDEMRSELRKSGKTISAVILNMSADETYAAQDIIKLNALWRRLPVIASADSGDEAVMTEIMARGAAGLALRPFGANLLKHTLANIITITEKAALSNTFRRDKLTGLLNREGFLDTADSMIRCKESGFYVLSCFDVENFKVINDQYGLEKGDMVLKHVADTISSCVSSIGGICCRFMADKFGMLFPAEYRDSDIVRQNHKEATEVSAIGQTIRIRIGRYFVDDLSISVSAMYDRAKMAEESIKNRYDIYIAEYSASMRDNLLHQQQVVNDMSEALVKGQFEPWFQPQFNHLTGAMIGAEALVRWKKDGEYIPPARFVPVFEKNGFIYEMDKYVWETVCSHLRRWLDEGRSPLPVSVNVSRRDLLENDCIAFLSEIVKKYELPYDLLRLEVTESAFAESTSLLTAKVDELIKLGFTVEIDDFGSGYSSLNTLKDVPASIIKLDMRFFDRTENSQRSGNIIESIVRMAKWLGMAVIAEGVEEKVQADYLRSIGCYYIQGYFYSRPVPLEDYETFLDNKGKEHELAKLKTLETLNSNEFWSPKSMETLIFNSYVGGACIFEYHDGRTELLRANERYADELGYFKPCYPLEDNSPYQFLDEDNSKAMLDNIHRAIETSKESFCELVLDDKKGHTEFIRSTVRVIANTGGRYLFYCVILNHTDQHMAVDRQREAEKMLIESAQRLQTIMGNISGGVSALVIDSEWRSRLIFCNERYYGIYGYTKEQAEAEGIDFLTRVLKKDLEIVKTKLTMLMQSGVPVTIDFRALKRNGELVFLRANSSLMHMDDCDDTVITSVITDITEEKTTLEKLMLLTNNIPGGIAKFRVSDGAVTILYLSDGVYDLTGYSPDELDTLSEGNALFLASADDSEMLMRKLYEALDGDGKMDCDFRARLKDGSTRWVNIHGSVAERSGTNAILNVVFLDIDDRKLAEENFLRSQSEISRRYEHELHLRREVIKDSPVSLTLNLTTNTIEEYDSTVDDVHSTGDMKIDSVKLFNNLVESVAPEDREAVRETLFPDKLLEAYRNNTTNINIEFRRMSPLHHYHWVRTVVTIIRRPGTEDIIAFLYVKDIDLVKKNLLALESIINEEIEAVSIINVASGLQRIINAETKLSYVEPDRLFHHDRIANKIIDNNVVPEDREMCRNSLMMESIKKKLDSDGSMLLSFRVKGNNGEILRKRSLIYYLDETHDDIVVSDRDITHAFEEEQNRQRELQKAVDAANEASKAKSEFLSRMSHDMRTPLNGVIGMVKLAKEESNPKQLSEYLENIDVSGHFLLGLINDVLDISKIESGRIVLKEEPFLAEDFMRNINTIIQPMMDAKHIEFVVGLNCGADCIIVDKLRFMQIFFNLLTNAAKYTNEYGRVEFLAEHIPDKDGKHGMRFIVRDNGIGMSGDYMERMYEPFSQEQADRTGNVEGSGLGLTIVKNLVETTGGRITVHSEIDKGTEFTVDVYAKMGSVEEAKSLVKKNDTDLSGLNVLVIEDNKVNVMVARKLLEKKKCSVDDADDGLKGVKRFLRSDENYYDVILMDIRMPVMDGIDAAKAIRSAKRSDALTVPIIATTADAFSENEQALYDAGMNGRIIKPIEPDALYEMIGKLKERKEKIRKDR